MKLRNDTIRIDTLIGYGSFNEIYFGASGNLSPGIDYNQKKFVFEVEPRFRLGGGNWFVGAEYRFDSTDTTLDIEIPEQEGGDNAPVSGTRRVAGLTGVVAFDSRDNLYQSRHGRLFEVYLGTYQPWLGSSDSFNKGKLVYRHFFEVSDRLVVGTRMRSEFVDGDDAPFFEQPYLELRGYARGEIRDDVTLWGEAEARYDLFWKIGGAVFAGLGWSGERYSELFDDSGRVAAGFGLRYALRPQDGLRIGIDMAWSPDNNGLFYLRVGESF
jgi:outer membrane protein assembly factor BamA